MGTLKTRLAIRKSTFVEHRYVIGFIALTALAIGLRFFMLSEQSLWFDEGLSLIRSDGKTLSEVLDHLNSTKYDKYQPTYFIALYYWRQTFGDSATAIRSLSVFFGILSVAFTALTASRLYGPNHALWTTAILSLSAFHIYYSQEVRPYSLVFLFAAVELFLFCRAVIGEQGRTLWQSLVFWIVVAIGSLSSLFIAIFTLSICVAHFFVKRNWRSWLCWWMPFAVSILPAAFLYSTSSSLNNWGLSLTTHTGSWIPVNFVFVGYSLLAGLSFLAAPEQLRTSGKVELLVSYWPHICLLLLAITAIVYGLIVKVLRTKDFTRTVEQRSNLFFIYLTLASFLLTALFVMKTQINWVPRHSAYAILGISVLIPSSFSASKLNAFNRKVSSKIALAGTVLLILLNFSSLNNYFFDAAYARDDYQAVAQYVAQENVKSVLVFGQLRLLEYYGDTTTTYVRGTDFEAADLAMAVRQSSNNADEVLVLVNREHTLRYSVEKALSKFYEVTGKESFTYFDIYRARLDPTAISGQ